MRRGGDDSLDSLMAMVQNGQNSNRAAPRAQPYSVAPPYAVSSSHAPVRGMAPGPGMAVGMAGGGTGAAWSGMRQAPPVRHEPMGGAAALARRPSQGGCAPPISGRAAAPSAPWAPQYAAAPAPALAAAPAAPGKLTHGFAADQNVRCRKYMEDDHAVVDDFCGEVGWLYAGLYDGHGGRSAVDFLTGHLHATVERELRGGVMGARVEPVEALSAAFSKVDRMLMQLGCRQCGATAAVCLFMRSAAPSAPLEVHVANAGDTRVVLVREGAPAVRLSVDHTAADPAEVRRVELAGGRIINNRVGGTLAVSRALGDHVLKGPNGGVTPEPHCITHRAVAGDRFLLMASDGVWDVMSDDEAQELVLQHAAEHQSPAEIAREIVSAALARGSCDNISALLIGMA